MSADDDVADNIAEMKAFLERHPEVTWLYPGHARVARYTATWTDPDADPAQENTQVTVSNNDLGRLVAYLKDYFEHEIVPVPGSMYSVGPRNAGRPANLGSDLHHPVEARCDHCGRRIVRDAVIGDRSKWAHEDRKP